MIQIHFGSWRVDARTARQDWAVEASGGSEIRRVRVAAFRADQAGDWQERDTQRGVEELDVTRHAGPVTLRVQVSDAQGRIFQDETVVEVHNFVAPSPPEFLWYEREELGFLIFKWGAVSVSPSVRSWRLYHRVDGENRLLVELPVDQRLARIAMRLPEVREIFVRGVDETGRESEDSPRLGYATVRGAPEIRVGQWLVTNRRARIDWTIASPDFIIEVQWRLRAGDHEVSGTGHAIDDAEIDVFGFIGTVRLDLVARDSQDRTSSLTASTIILNVPPETPQLVADEIGMHFIRLRAIPQVGATNATQIEVEGPGQLKTIGPPWLVVFDGLAGNTPVGFRTRALNATGVASAWSQTYGFTTLADPTELPAPQQVDFLESLLDKLGSDMRQYLLQLYSETRVRAPGAKQFVRPPTGFDALLDQFLPLAPRLGDLLRAATDDVEIFRAAELIDRVADPIQKLVVLCERLEYGAVWKT